MQITGSYVQIVEGQEPKTEDKPKTKLLAYVEVTLDDLLCIRDVRLLRTAEGRLIISMPDQKLHGHCPDCRMKCYLQDQYCRRCGKKIDLPIHVPPDGSRPIIYRDIVFPVQAWFRSYLTDEIIRLYYEARNPLPREATMVV
jgi:DNA-binding cell septation regulator SpoVG